MGACVSSAKGRTLSHKRDANRYPGQYNADPVRRSGVFRTAVSIINNPSKDNVREKYSFGQELGRGEFGITYRCTDVETGEQFACKTISKSKLRTEIDVADVRREVEIMRNLPRHPNIVTFREAYEDKEAVYLVMELCKGGELFDRIVQSGHFTERAASKITKTIIEVIKMCHDNGVIHRDLKPENFLFASASELSPLKAIDFGLSTFFEPGQHFHEIVGSPYYMAPEVLRRDYGSEVDVWSAGVILYILLCGVPPFWAETEEGIAQAIVRGEIDFTRDPWQKVSAEAKDLVKSMLNPNPYERLTVNEVLKHSWIQNTEKASNIPLGENVRLRIKQFSLMNKFKKKVLRVVAGNLPDEQVDSIKEMFDTMDTDKNGDLTFEELKHGFSSYGQFVQDQDVQMFMDAADVDGSGTINREEFLTMSVHLKRIGSDEHLSRAFEFFDKNQSGYIEFGELKDAMEEENLGLNDEKVIKDIIFDADIDKDGRISYDEFKAMMTTGMDWKMASRQYSRAMLNALSMKMFKDSSTRSTTSHQTGQQLQKQN